MRIRRRHNERRLLRDVRRTALSTTTTSAAVVYPLVFASVGIGAWIISGATVAANLVIAAGLVALPPLAVFAYLKRRRFYSRVFVQELNNRLALKRDRDLVRVASVFQSHDHTKGARQVRELKDRLSTLSKLIDERFSKKELAHHRYTMLVENVYRSTLYNFRQLLTLVETIKLLDMDGVRREVTALKSGASRKEPAELNERIARFHDLQKRHDTLVEKNDAANNVLERACAKLSSIRTAEPAGMRLEESIEALTSLVELSDRYDISAGRQT